MMQGGQGVPTIRQVNPGTPIDNTDRYGRSMIDAIHMGLNALAAFTCEEFRAGSLAAFWPFAALWGRIGVVGKLYYNMAAPLVMTAVAGTTAYGSPFVLQGSKAILAPQFDGSLLFGPELRTVPIRQVLLPYDPGDSLGIACFTTV
jgi:hypothetical protein